MRNNIDEDFSNFVVWFEENFPLNLPPGVKSRDMSLLKGAIDYFGIKNWEIGYRKRDKEDFFLVLRDLPYERISFLEQRYNVTRNSNVAKIYPKLPSVEWDREIRLMGRKKMIEVKFWEVEINLLPSNKWSLKFISDCLHDLPSEIAEMCIEKALFYELGESFCDENIEQVKVDRGTAGVKRVSFPNLKTFLMKLK